MPVLTKELLARQLQQNWNAAQYPRVEQIANGNARETLDDSLTSLNWLQNLNISYMNGGTPPPESPPSATDPMLREGMKVDPNQVLPTHSCHHLNGLRYPGVELGNPHLQFERINYRTNPYIKPPYSYAALICMAMKESKKAKITLASIYSWITDNFMYYRMADPSWQNSIRHNLSLNKCFEKVARGKDEPGKGGFWRMNPNYNESVQAGTPRKKRTRKENDSEPGKKKRKTKAKSSRSSTDTQSPHSSEDEGTYPQALTERQTADLFAPLSPPTSSDENSNDIEDIIAEFQDSTEPYSDSDPLSLSVQGVRIEAPEWWSDSLTGAAIQGIFEPHHPWSVDKSDIEEAIQALEDVERIVSNGLSSRA